ncbi:arsenate reductase family protein [Aureitalea marina]|uniref:Arsenate reductase n=1 Tax=Aureitalea marina TaxID=930804 RepID=A0A2S7KRR2_9FLAO|nr:ArsC/Spx/MgsR family protein [Aureitalea marina]PQB05306.1 hypothetical protein BST85_10735 [Aureitalea marina]
MKKFYHLGTCDTCKRIARELDLPSEFERIDIKKKPFEAKELESLKELAGSYEALFSRRAKLYKERGLGQEDLSEADYKNFLLEHYTFLKRPVLINGDQIFIGNSKKIVEAARASLA